jgi:Na+-translocating ferredoxin:NAD+ oxidoreductase RnfG subunit
MSDADRGLFGVLGAVALMVPATVVVAADYLSIDAAQRAVYPQAESFEPVLLSLSPAQKQTIVARAGPQPQHGALRIWNAKRGDTNLGYVFVDEVIGRSDLITYATGIDPNGALHTIEILAYRESHGAEIRNAAWRQQFANRNGLAQLQFRTDIKNISGATLSSEHVTQGVRWIVALWETALKPDIAVP